MKKPRPGTVELALRRADRAVRIALRDERTAQRPEIDPAARHRGPLVGGRAAG